MSKRRSAAAERTAANEAYARLADDVCALLRALAPSEEALGHFRNARAEVLKGLRAVIDARIERLSTERARTKGRSVEIE